MPRSEPNRTADAIQEAAAQLFFEHGYAATSLREVASAVGIQVGSLYNHIEGKHQLLRDMMLGIMDELLAAMVVAAAETADPVKRLERALDCHIRFHATHSRAVFIGNSELRSLDEVDRKVVSSRRREYERMLREMVEDVGSAGHGDILDARLQAYAIVAIGTHVATWYRPGGSLSLDDVVSTYTQTIFRQLGVAPDLVTATA